MVTNFNFNLSDKPDQRWNQAILYILDPYLKAVISSQEQWVKVSIIINLNVCDILPSLNEIIKFTWMNIDQAPKGIWWLLHHCTLLLYFKT